MILVAQHTHTAAEMSLAVDAIAAAHPSREAFRGRWEYLDDWIR